MKQYSISFGNGTAWPEIRMVTVEDFECEQDAVDRMIDEIESCGDTGLFVTQDEVDSGECGEDEYIVGGNHGRFLRHYGLLAIEEVKSMRIKLNTDLLPVVSVGMYESSLSMDSMFDEEFCRMHSSESLTEDEKKRFYIIVDSNEYADVVEKYGLEALGDFFRDIREHEGLDITLADEEAELYSPKEYNFRTDELEFTIELSEATFGKIISLALENDEFWKWAKKRYRSYDGFICFMPNNRSEFIRQLGEGQLDRIVASYLTFLGETAYDCNGEFGYTYSIYEKIKTNHVFEEFINEEAQSILQRA